MEVSLFTVSVLFLVLLCNVLLIPLILVIILYVMSRIKYKEHPHTADSVVLITGCDSGIGMAATKKLLKEGFHVISTVFTDNGKRSLQEYASSIDASDRITITSTDITNDSSVEALDLFVATFLKENSSKNLVGLVNNAGIALSGPLEVQPMAQFRRQIDVNLIGHVHVSQVMIKYLRKAKGRIVNIVSAAGRCTASTMGAYCASKFAMEAITDCQRLELARWEISVSAIEPGFVRTPLVINSTQNMERSYDSFLPGAKQLYAHELSKGKKKSATILSYAIDPSHVADKIYHALTATCPKTRYLVGYDAHIFCFLFGVLPNRLVDAIASLI